jgi:hypothetical protein
MTDHHITFDSGSGPKPALVVKHNQDGTVGLFAPEGDGDDVKFFDNIPEGEGGLTYQKAGA